MGWAVTYAEGGLWIEIDPIRDQDLFKIARAIRFPDGTIYDAILGKFF